MTLHAFISGLPESLASGPLLPVAAVVIWVALAVIFNQRYKQRFAWTAAPSANPVTPSELRRSIVAAAHRMHFPLGSTWLPPAPGDGYNKELDPGREGIVGYVDYDEDFHSPRDIDRRRISPRGVPQVPLIQQPHENVALVVIDVNQMSLAGSPADKTDKLEAVKQAAWTVVEKFQQDNCAISLLATRQQQPIYLRPGTAVEEIVEAIHRLQVGDKPGQSQELRRLAIDHSQRTKAVAVIGHFDSDDALGLIGRLPEGATKVAAQVTSQWQHDFGGLPGQIDVEYAPGRLARFDTDKDAPAYRLTAEDSLDRTEDRIKQGDVIFCRLRLDVPDIPGQLATAVNRGSRN